MVVEVGAWEHAVAVEFCEFGFGDVGENEGGDVALVGARIEGLDGVRGGVRDVETVVESFGDEVEDLADRFLVRRDEGVVECVLEAEADQRLPGFVFGLELVGGDDDLWKLDRQVGRSRGSGRGFRGGCTGWAFRWLDVEAGHGCGGGAINDERRRREVDPGR